MCAFSFEKLACFEREKRQSIFERNFQVAISYFTYQTSEKQNKNFCVIYTIKKTNTAKKIKKSNGDPNLTLFKFLLTNIVSE